MTKKPKSQKAVLKIEDLQPFKSNPRKVTDARLAVLRKQLLEFGDLGGVVFNVTSKELVTAHQRVKEFDRAKADIRVERRFKPATRSGTTAEGVIVVNGERFSYREVEWPERKARLAMVAANNHAGEWEEETLRGLLKEIDDESQYLTGFDSKEIDRFLKNNKRPVKLGGPLKSSENYSLFELVMLHQNKKRLVTTLSDLRRTRKLKTLEEALMFLVETFLKT